MKTAPTETHRRAIGLGVSNARIDNDLIERIRAVRQRSAALVNIDGKPRFIDEAVLFEPESEAA